MKYYISPSFEEMVLAELSLPLADSNIDFSAVSNEDLVDSGYVMDWE